MSNSWTLRVLCRGEQLHPRHIQGVVADLFAIGFGAAATEDGSLSCMAADGSGSLLFNSFEAATSWLATSEGLLPLRNVTWDLDADLSVHRRTGILAVEMEHLPDEPAFDVLALSVSETELIGPRRDFIWASVQESMIAVLGSLPFSFAYGLDEATSEVVADFSCVHRRIASNRFPPFLPWICAVSENSELSPALEMAAQVVGRPIRTQRGIRLLTLSDEPWDRPDQVVAEASSLWREAVSDGGCS